MTTPSSDPVRPTDAAGSSSGHLRRPSVAGMPPRLLPAVLALLLVPFTVLLTGAPAQAAGFSAGNVVVLRVGDGSGSLSSAAAPVFLDEYSPSGALVQSVPMPTTGSGDQRRLVASGSATSEGALALSADGRYLTLAGYDAAPGTAAIAGTPSATVSRVVARVDAAGAVDTTTALADAFTGTNIRGAVTDDGSRFWTTGGNGVRFASLGATTSAVLASTNTRVPAIADGELFYSTGAGTQGVYRLGSGLPTTGSPAAALVAARTSPYGVTFLDRSDTVPGVDTLYLADDSSAANGGGVHKFSFDGTTWTARGSVTAGTLRGLTGQVTSTGAALVGTTGSTLVTLTDTAAFDAPIEGSFSTLATAASNTALRGVALAPTGETTDTGPTITTQPSDATVAPGAGTTLTVSASGTAPLSYQWFAGTTGDTTSPVGTDAASYDTGPLTQTSRFWVRVTNALGSDDSDTATVTVDDTPACEGSATQIGAVQGSGETSPLAGQSVTVRGVVVGDYEGASPALGGFYLQDEGDGDPATSDAVFVFDRGLTGAQVSLGDRVEVTGTAGEFQGQTQVNATAVDGCGTGDVTPTDLTLPMADAAAFERYEGMLVRFDQTLTVTEHFQLGRFGEVVVSSGGRLQQPTAVVAPGAAAQTLQAENALNRLKIDDALNNQNADPIVFGRGGAPLSAANTLRGGDTVTDPIGVLTYTWGGNSASPNTYRLRPVDALHGSASFTAVNDRPTGAPVVGGDLTVVSANLLNLFNSFGTTGCTFGVGGAVAECRGADNAAELERQLAKHVAALTRLDADVVAVMEIENDGYGPDSALQLLIDRLNAVDGPEAWAFVDPDTALGVVNAAGTDAIKTALIYRADRVTPVAGRTFADTGAPAGVWDRVPVAQQFTSPDGDFSVVANHFKSKGSCPAAGSPDADQGDGQSCWNARRTVQAERLLEFVEGTVIGTSGDPDVLLAGDFNSYAQEDPVTALTSAGWTDLAAHAADEAAGAPYSYVFDGQWGYLDYVFASESMLAQVTGAADYHVNADEPSVLDYNTNFKSPGQIASLFAPDEFRTSDHDPVVVGLSLADPDTTPPLITATVAGTTGEAGWFTGDVVVDWTVVDPESDVEVVGCQDTTVVDDTTGLTLTCEATSAGGTSSESVTVKRDATAPDLAWSGAITQDASYVFGEVPARPTCTASDATSGPAGCTVTGYDTRVGTHTLTATATDVAGNTTVQTRTYTVSPWTLRGFQPPVDNDGVVNVVRRGSRVPLRFEVFAGDRELTSTSVVRSIGIVPVACPTGAREDRMPETTRSRVGLAYVGGRFQLVWETPKVRGCRQVTVTTRDGSSISALFRLQ